MAIAVQGPRNTNPVLDSLSWGGWEWANAPIRYYFDPSGGAWTAVEKAAYKNALQSWANVANVQFAETTTSANANFIESLFQANDGTLGSHDTPEIANGQGHRAYGTFNRLGAGWDENNTNGGLQVGGFGYLTLVHEIGHALGLAHPHDTGGGSPYFPGLGPGSDPYTDMGNYNLNQDVYTVMSYVHGEHYTKPVAGGAFADNYGYVAGPMAFDIAAIQFKYGANMNYKTGNDTYVVPGQNGGGTFYRCIWDAGGNDTIRYDGAQNVGIRLAAATLESADWGGGGVSGIPGVHGGFTIAHGVVIENAIGGSGSDLLQGNHANNSIWGNGGNDSIEGGAGNDYLVGGPGNDGLWGGYGNDVYVLGSEAIVDFIRDDSGNDTIATTISRSLLTIVNDYAAVENLLLQGGAAISGTGDHSANGIVGNSAANVLAGLGGIDTLFGMGGNDLLFGQGGRDNLRGDAGNDSFVYQFAADSLAGATCDIIMDFDDNGNDTINLSAVFGPVLTYRGAAAFTGIGQVRINDIAGPNLIVEINLSGGAVPEMQIFLQNTTLAMMGIDDFLL